MRYLLVLMLAGCATTRPTAIDYSVKPPADWPKLAQRVNYIAKEDLAKFCPESIHKAMNACAATRFRIGVCDIYTTVNDAATLEHERAHCLGYGHVGNAKAPTEAWETFKSRRVP